MSLRISIGAIGITAGLAAVALACSLDTPFQLLDDRQATLAAPIINSFEFEIGQLAGSPRDGLKAVEYRWGGPAETRSRVEAEEIGPQVAHVRSAETAEQALQLGRDLPEAVRIYTAGAVAFHKGEKDAARRLFGQVLELPDPQRRPRAVWAAYMLGKLAVAEDNLERAGQAFALTRSLAVAGIPDPLGLAVASYGEEARIHFRTAKILLRDDALPADAAERYVSELATAVALYGEQAIRGSEIGSTSLQVLALHLLRDNERTKAALHQPQLRRFLTAYLLARTQVTGVIDPDEFVEGEGFYNLPPTLPMATVLEMIAEEAERRGDAVQPEFDRLASLAYQSGRYDLARRFVAKAEGALAFSLRAKLALQAGDTASAARFYAEAIRLGAGANEPNGLEAGNRRRVVGEAGVLAMGTGDYAQALNHLLDAGHTYWGDITHVAERVMTVDELKRFVDAWTPPPAPAEHPDPNGPVIFMGGRGYAPDKVPTPFVLLRDLLARRLVRESRIAEALPYFAKVAVRDKAAAYEKALHLANSRWTDIGKAEAWFLAAYLARHQGMEIMGTEASPDFFYWAGDYDYGIGQTPERLQSPVVGDDERARFAGSAAQPEWRFHYRYIAVEEALRAADLLPPRSQAFAAVLCHASYWGGNSWEIYRRYVEQGAAVPFASHFGRSCPAPDFTAASVTMRRQMVRQARSFVSTNRWPIAAASSLLVVAAGLLWWRRKA